MPRAKVGAFLVLLMALGWPGPGADAGEPDATPERTAAESALDAKALAELELESSRIRDELSAAEARLALMAEKLFRARLRVSFRGEVERPFRLRRVELWLDGALAHAQDLLRPPSVQALELFDGYLPPGRHLLELRLWAHGPGDPEDAPPGYFAGSGLAVQLREDALTLARFEAEQGGRAPGPSEPSPRGRWDVEIEASFQTGG